MSNNEQLREKCPLCDGKVNIVPGTKNKEVMQGQCERCHVSADVEWFRAGGKTEVATPATPEVKRGYKSRGLVTQQADDGKVKPVVHGLGVVPYSEKRGGWIGLAERVNWDGEVFFSAPVLKTKEAAMAYAKKLNEHMRGAFEQVNGSTETLS